MTSPTRWKGTRAPPFNGVANWGMMDTNPNPEPEPPKTKKRGGVDYPEAQQEQRRGA